MLDITDILKDLKGGSYVSPSVYDLAYYGSSELADHDVIQSCLLESQNIDGSWGSSYFFREERLVNTLAVIRYFDQIQVTSKEIDDAKSFCKKEALNFADAVTRPVAFELIFPHLWNQVFGEGHLPPSLSYLLNKSLKKLRAIPVQKVFSKPTTLLHTLEVFENHDVPWDDISHLVSKSGNVGNSPAATTVYHNKTKDESSRNFLASLTAEHKGSIPVNYPIDIFERNWILYFQKKYNLVACDLVKDDHVSYLQRHWGKNGITWSCDFPIPDLDDTSVSWMLLNQHGHNPSVDVFAFFENDGSMKCFPGEIQASPTHLAHFVEAMDIAGAYEGQKQKSISSIKKFQSEAGYWLDKWHVSPFYATSQVLLSCAHHLSGESEKSVDWLLRSQNADGGWGMQFSTQEESSYAILTLDHVYKIKPSSKIRESIKLASNYFSATESMDYTPLWIDKNLYCPYKIVDSVVLAALKQVKDYYE